MHSAAPLDKATGHCSVALVVGFHPLVNEEIVGLLAAVTLVASRNAPQLPLRPHANLPKRRVTALVVHPRAPAYKPVVYPPVAGGGSRFAASKSHA